MSMLTVAFAAAADTNVSVTVGGITEGNTLKLYRVASVSVAADNTLSFTMTENLPEAYNTIEKIEAIQDADDVTTMANAFGAFFAGKEAAYSQPAGSDEKAAVSVAPGYYYAIVEGTENSGIVYKPMLINAVPVADPNGTGAYVAHDAIDTTAKSEPVTITKTEDKTPTDASQVKTTDGYSVGDDINFTITTEMPNYPANATKAKAIITDTPTGLIDDVNTVQVFINGSATATEAGDDTFTVAATAANGFTVTFAQSFILAHPGESIVVKYTAELQNPGNVTATTENEATITYNTNPYVDSEVEPGDETEQNNYGVYVFKYKDGTDPKEALQGAKFKLVAANAEGTAPADPEVIVGEEKTTDANGYLYWEGLKNGTYFIIETAAPANYRLDSTPHAVVLDKTNATLDNPATTDKTEQYYNKAEIPNTEGTTLPSTGGMGTTILYVGGSILVILAAILLITKRRMNAND